MRKKSLFTPPVGAHRRARGAGMPILRHSGDGSLRQHSNSGSGCAHEQSTHLQFCKTSQARAQCTKLCSDVAPPPLADWREAAYRAGHCPDGCSRKTPCLIRDFDTAQLSVSLYCSLTTRDKFPPLCFRILGSQGYNPYCLPLPRRQQPTDHLGAAPRRRLRARWNRRRLLGASECTVWANKTWGKKQARRIEADVGLRTRTKHVTFGTTVHTPDQLTNRVLLVTGPVSDGFWVRVITVLVHATWAKLNGLSVAVRYSSERDNYFDRAMAAPDEDGWTLYFEPINPPTGASTNFVQLGCHAGARAWEQFGSYATGSKEAAAQRETRVRLMAELGVRPRKRWVREVDDFWVRHVEPFGAGRPVIGVHMRATDKAINIVPTSTYIRTLNAFMCHFPNAIVFVATDNEVSLEAVRQWSRRSRHRAPVVSRPAIRSRLHHSRCDRQGLCTITNPGVHAHVLNLTAQAATLGEDVLLDTLLLARANFLLKGTSAVADFALYFNPTLAANTVDYELSSSPRHDWANLSRCPQENIHNLGTLRKYPRPPRNLSRTVGEDVQ